VSRLGDLFKDLGPWGRRGLIAGVVGVVVLVGLALLGPIVRWQAVRRAARAGFVVEVDRVRLGTRGLWLLGVHGRSERPGVLDASVDAVLVPLGAGPLEVHGGTVRLRGTPRDVEAAFGAGNRAQSTAKPRGVRPMRVDGVFLEWSEIEPGLVARAWGMGFSRATGEEVVAADLVRVDKRGLRLEARGPEAVLSTGAGRVLQTAKGRGLSVWFDADARPVPAPRPSDAVDRPTGGTAAAPSGMGGLLALSKAMSTRALAEGATVRFGEVRVDLVFSGEHLGFGPSSVEVRRSRGEVTLEMAQGAGATGGTPLSLRGHLPLLTGEPSLELEGGPVTLGLLGIEEGELGLTRLREATLEAHAKIELMPGEGGVRASGSGRLLNLSIHRPALAREEIRGLNLGFRGRGEAMFDRSRLVLDDLELTIGETKLGGSFEFVRGAKGYRLQSKGGVPLASCAGLFRSLPAALTNDLRGMELEGTFSLGVDVAFDPLRVNDLKVKLDVKNDCRIAKIPEGLSPSRFRGIWTREVRGPEGPMMPIQSGPGAPNWVPYARIPKTMEIAVLVCEDGGFYRHRGFDFRAIEKAIKEDVLAGRFARGASTISMQLAKNLYLGTEKTLSRKVQEAFLTMLLEQQLSKQELMELYLNVVELGPGIYGIQAAADHYFDSDATDLSLGQALYLASILPDPTRQHFDPDGRLGKRWVAYIQKLMRIAHEFKRITDAELEQGLAEEIAFRKPAEPHQVPGDGARSFAAPPTDGAPDQGDERPDDGAGP